MRHRTRPAGLDDEALARLVGEGDAAAFELLYDRHHRALLAFCRHMLGNREDGEDALQQAFVRAHRTLSEGRAPDAVRPWLFAIARNRCLTLLGARRDAAVAVEDVELSFDGLDADVERRSDLRELLADLSQLPDDQRGALVLAELGDLNHAEIAAVIGCPAPKVKALVFQARTSLIADRDARRTPCDEIRTQLETARGGVLRRGALRRHLRLCDPCAAYRHAMEGRRSGLAILLPVAPTAGLKAGVLAGAGGLGGGAEGAAAAAALLGSSGLGGAATAGAGVAGGGAATAGAGVAGGGAATAGAVAGGVAAKALAAKVAVAVALGAGAAGGGVAAVHDDAREAPVRQAVAERAGARVPATPSRGARPVAAPGADAPAAPAAAAQTLPAASTQARDRPGLRRVAARRLRAADGAQRRRLFQRIRRHRHRLRTGGTIARKRRRAAAEAALVVGEARPGRRRRGPGATVPVPTATPSPTATPGPTSRRRPRGRRPGQSPTPVPTPKPKRPSPPVQSPTPADAPMPAPTPRPRRPRPPEATQAPAPAPAPRPRRPRPPEATPAPAPAPAATPSATPTPDP